MIQAQIQEEVKLIGGYAAFPQGTSKVKPTIRGWRLPGWFDVVPHRVEERAYVCTSTYSESIEPPLGLDLVLVPALFQDQLGERRASEWLLIFGPARRPAMRLCLVRSRLAKT